MFTLKVVFTVPFLLSFWPLAKLWLLIPHFRWCSHFFLQTETSCLLWAFLYDSYYLHFSYFHTLFHFFKMCIFSYFSSSKVTVYLTIDVIIYLVTVPSLMVHKLLHLQASGALYTLKCGVIYLLTLVLRPRIVVGFLWVHSRVPNTIPGA